MMEEEVPIKGDSQAQHSHTDPLSKEQLQGYLHKERSSYCRSCKRESKSTDANKDNFDLASCFLKKNAIKDDAVQQAPEIKGYERDQSDYYFDSYSHFNIHEDMLKDTARTKTYMNSMIKNKHLFEGKTVLDIGCGTGILSIFAARAGAKHVYAVDNANIIKHARKIVENNGLSDRITMIQGKMEEIVLPVEFVDIIISEWMGYFLLYESMLDCVLDARDKYLAQGGFLFPDTATMFVSSFCSDQIYEDRFNFWENVYGVDMSCIKGWVFNEPLIDYMDRDTLNGDIVKFKEFDLYTTQKSDLDFVADYSLKIRRNDYVQGVAVWWDVQFNHGDIPLKISTSPFARETHWKQTMFFIKNEDIPVTKGDTLSGTIALQKSEDNPRDIDVKISYKLNNAEIDFDRSQIYKIC